MRLKCRNDAVLTVVQITQPRPLDLKASREHAKPFDSSDSRCLVILSHSTVLDPCQFMSLFTQLPLQYLAAQLFLMATASHGTLQDRFVPLGVSTFVETPTAQLQAKGILFPTTVWNLIFSHSCFLRNVEDLRRSIFVKKPIVEFKHIASAPLRSLLVPASKKYRSREVGQVAVCSFAQWGGWTITGPSITCWHVGPWSLWESQWNPAVSSHPHPSGQLEMEWLRPSRSAKGSLRPCAFAAQCPLAMFYSGPVPTQRNFENLMESQVFAALVACFMGATDGLSLGAILWCGSPTLGKDQRLSDISVF